MPLKNQLLLKIGVHEILMKATFENLEAMENDVGGIPYLAYKYGRAVTESGQVTQEAAAKALPSITEASKIIFHVQSPKKYTQQEIFDLVMQSGIECLVSIVKFIMICTSGNTAEEEKVTSSHLEEQEKKSSIPQERQTKKKH